MSTTNRAFRASSMILAFSVAIALTSSPAPDAHAQSDSQTLHVAKDHARASDNNPGTRQKPLATITEASRRALRRSAAGKRTRVIIRPGVYREGIEFHASEKKHKLGAVVFKGVGRSPVVISGSDVWKGWSHVPETEIYTHHWPHQWGETPLPPSWGDMPESRMPRVIRRREMIFVNRRPLTQVMSRQMLNSTKEGFYVSEDEKKVYIRVPRRIDIKEATIEVAVRPYLFGANHQENVAIHNVTFRHANTPLDTSAVFFAESRNIRVINSRFVRNNWGGLGISSSRNVLVRRTAANHNGVRGFSAGGSTDLRFVDTETSYNNWRGSRGWNKRDHRYAIRGHFIDFATGQKFVHLRDAIFRRHRSIGNLTGGLWFDTDNARILLDRVILRDNLTHGLFIEASQGPIILRDSVVCNNETGVLLQHSTDGVLKRNVIARNLLGQMLVAGIEEPRSVDDSETGKEHSLHAERWTLRGNKFRSRDGEYNLRTYLPPEQWELFVKSLTSNQNKWRYAKGDSRVFRIDGGRELTFERWKRYSGQDRHSEASASGASCGPSYNTNSRGGAGKRSPGVEKRDKNSDKRSVDKKNEKKKKKSDKDDCDPNDPTDSGELCDVKKILGIEAAPLVAGFSVAAVLATVLIFRHRKSKPPG